MTRLMLNILMLLFMIPVFAQKGNQDIAKGNEAYRAGQFDRAAESYRNALMIAPQNTTALFNLGNALYKSGDKEQAEKIFTEIIESSPEKNFTGNTWYNKGVTLTQQKKLEESIHAYKYALRYNPSDTLARENLVRALRELKKKQEQEQQQKNKEQKEKQEQKQQQKQSKLTKQQVQQLLQALEEQEKQLQQKMQKMKVPGPNQQEKDW